MTPEQLDEWIISKTDTHVIYEMMKDNTDVMVSVNFYPLKLVEEFGGDEKQWLYEVRDSLMRLLLSDRIFAVGINGWTTKAMESRTPITPQRILEVEMVKTRNREYTADLDFSYDHRYGR